MIFGSFAQQPIEQVLGVIAQRSGHLQVWRTTAGRTDHFELHLGQGQVLALFTNGVRMPDEQQACSVLQALFEARAGIFQFSLAPGKTLAVSYRLPLSLVVPTEPHAGRPVQQVQLNATPSFTQRLRQVIRRLPLTRQAA